MERISIQEFMNVELKVAKILSVEEHPSADKLIVLRVDAGEEHPRTLVAGLKPYYPDPQTLLGKSIVVVANLQPAKLRGIESNGMLLAAQDGDKVVVLTPDQEVTPGSKVS